MSPAPHVRLSHKAIPHRRGEEDPTKSDPNVPPPRGLCWLLLGFDLQPTRGGAGEPIRAIHILHRRRRMHEGARRHRTHEISHGGRARRLTVLRVAVGIAPTAA